MDYIEQEQEREEQERRKRELQAELLRNDEIIDCKADELTAILDEKIEKNTRYAKSFSDVSIKAQAIAEKMYKALDMLKEIEKEYPELKEHNEKFAQAIHDLEDIIKTMREKTKLFEEEADRLIAERKAELTKELDKVTNVPAYHKEQEQEKQEQKSKPHKQQEMER